MGWLRDLMQGAQPRYRSFGALARSMLAHPAWPAHVHTQPRSLATVLSKLDRDTDVEWLADRADVQRVLAELLGCTVADVQASVVAGGQLADKTTRRVRLDDVRYGRALDLAEESLPPGIPDAVTHPEAWTRLWWLAPSGSGRSLVGRWLAARGLARFESARSWPELGPSLATRAPVFVELAGSASAGSTPSRERLCVAAEFRPPDDDGWQIVESPPLEQYLGRLVEWVAGRLGSDTELDPDRAERWLRAQALPRAELGTLGAALGLCGLIDELGLKSLERSTLAQAARRYVELRLAEWRHDERGDTAGIERRAFDVLVGMVMHTLTDDDRPWSRPRSFDEWLQTVPPEHRHGADVDWLRVSLPRVDRTIRPSDVERAARSMPPGAYRIVRALRGARLLAPTRSENELALGPRWLGAVAAVEAERALVRASPAEWGEALLRPHAAAGVARALIDRVGRGETALIDQVLELSDEDGPASVAAVEASFCAAGLALLDGQELPSEAPDELWREQSRLWIELPGCAPAPRLLRAMSAEWSLAALAIFEHAAPPGSFEPELDAIVPLWASAPIERAAAIAALVDRARRARRGEPRHRLEQPGALLDQIETGPVRWQTVCALDAPERDIAALIRIGAERGVAFERVASELWNAWGRAETPALPALFQARALYAHLPTTLVGALLGRDVPYDAFAETKWAEALRILASEELPSPAAIADLWKRFPDALLAACQAQLAADRADLATRLLPGAPDAQGVELVRAFRLRAALDRMSDDALGELRRWLVSRVDARAEGWRDAYALLAELERLLASSRPRG